MAWDWRTQSRRRLPHSSRRCHARASPPPRGATSARSSSSAAWMMPSHWSMLSRPSISSFRRRMPSISEAASAMPAPFKLHLSIRGSRLVFDIRRANYAPVMAHLLSLSPLRRLVKDYFLICDSYYTAIRTATPDRIEALDMGRRALHDEGSHLLMERLKRKVTIDFDTARRLFTLICVLHWKG